MKKGNLITVKTEKMINQGICLGRIEGKIVFIEGCLPNEIVRASIQKVKKDYVEAKLIEVVEKSVYRITPQCKYFGLCGGCKLQNISYEQQLIIKKSFVEEAFQRISKLYGIKINDVIPSDDEYFYRNKMEYSFAKRWMFEGIDYNEKEKEFALGLHIPKQFDKVIHLDECFLQSQFSNVIRNFLAEHLFTKDVTIHSLRNKNGLLKALLIREAKNTNEKLIGLVTTRFDEVLINELSEILQKDFYEITTFVNIISSPNLSSTLAEKNITVFGKGYIIEKLLGYVFEIYPNTFFQTNTRQAEKLFSFVKKYLEFELKQSSETILLDLYCGVGVIGIILANHFDRVIAFEDLEDSIKAAKRNALINHIKNISFEKRNLSKGFDLDPILLEKDITIIVDPPRTGLTEKTLDSIIKIKPKRIIYISCNPVTQARDLMKLKNSYKIEVVQPFDMFPQTYHVENITILKIFS